MNDLERLKREYDHRERRLSNSDIYSITSLGYRFMKNQLQKNIGEMLGEQGFTDLTNKVVLELGCGNGNVLADFNVLGVKPENLFGVDLLYARVKKARENYPYLQLVCTDGQSIPFLAQTFDMVLQFTAFSSLLTNNVKFNLAGEMKRVLRPNGIIVWYDFWWNPFNRQTRGIGLDEVGDLFKGMQLAAKKITLAPPIGRKLAPLSVALCIFLEKLGVFNTHYLILIEPVIKRKL